MGTTTTEMKMFLAAKSQGELEGNLIETRKEKPTKQKTSSPRTTGRADSLAHTWVTLLMLRQNIPRKAT